MPEHASQGMQAFKSKRPGVSREGSSSAIPRIARERSREMTRERSHDGHGSRGSASRSSLTVPSASMTRRKSDLDREAKEIPSYAKKDYSGVKGSGYGATSSTPRKKSGEATSRSLSQPKIQRERSGHGTTTPTKSLSQPKIKREKSGSAIPRKSGTESTLSPGGNGSATSTTPKIQREKSSDVYSRLYGTPKTTASTTAARSAGKSTTTTAKTTGSSDVKKRTTSTKSTASATAESPVVGEVEIKVPSTKTKSGGGSVFDRLTTTGTATKKSSSKPASTKTTTSTKTSPSKSSKSEAKPKGTVKK